jgi:hypothetical protein
VSKKISVIYCITSLQAQDMGSAYDRRLGISFLLNRVPDFSHGYMTKDQVSDPNNTFMKRKALNDAIVCTRLPYPLFRIGYFFIPKRTTFL